MVGLFRLRVIVWVRFAVFSPNLTGNTILPLVTFGVTTGSVATLLLRTTTVCDWAPYKKCRPNRQKPKQIHNESSDCKACDKSHFFHHPVPGEGLIATRTNGVVVPNHASFPTYLHKDASAYIPNKDIRRAHAHNLTEHTSGNLSSRSLNPDKPRERRQRRTKPEHRWNAVRKTSHQRRMASCIFARSRVMFFWWDSSVPPPISSNLASRHRRSTWYSPTYP